MGTPAAPGTMEPMQGLGAMMLSGMDLSAPSHPGDVPATCIFQAVPAGWAMWNLANV